MELAMQISSNDKTVRKQYNRRFKRIQLTDSINSSQKR